MSGNPRLPSVDLVLRQGQVRSLAMDHGLEPVTELVRSVLAEHRSSRPAIPTLSQLISEIDERARRDFLPSLRGVVNATGVVIHTNLGRAPLSEDALRAIRDVSRGYSNLEFDLAGGQRGSRYAHLEDLLCKVSGAEAAMAVNNNASALFLVLSAFCRDKEVIISRGQLVEIGGGFRIPDVMAQSGARLVEVGTTNRTYLADYERAISEHMAALVRVHSSNFRTVGFTAEAPIGELAELAHANRLMLLDDLGSGCLIDTTQFGLQPEPLVQSSVAAGADLVMFSGDKLLGGPQAGLIVGRRRLIDQLRSHPLSRVLRMDKASIAALNATLKHYWKGEALEKVPVWRMIAASEESLRRRARSWQRAVGSVAGVRAGRSMVGGGSLPGESLPTTLLKIPEAEGVKPEVLANTLRNLPRPIVARVAGGSLLLDPRTVDPSDDRYVSSTLDRILRAEAGSGL
jgi:L-seryl-tRNA(Ser) seleniumtransferase